MFHVKVILRMLLRNTCQQKMYLDLPVNDHDEVAIYQK